MRLTTIIYNGKEMAASWPTQIRAAQRKPSAMRQGRRYLRIPYGHERQWADVGVPVQTTACRDCGVLPGQLHVAGCCVEACPVCREGQAITCEMEDEAGSGPCYKKPIPLCD